MPVADSSLLLLFCLPSDGIAFEPFGLVEERNGIRGRGEIVGEGEKGEDERVKEKGGTRIGLVPPSDIHKSDRSDIRCQRKNLEQSM